MPWALAPDSACGWIRVGRLIIQWKHRDNRALFSERNGYVRFLKVPRTLYRVHIGREKK